MITYLERAQSDPDVYLDPETGMTRKMVLVPIYAPLVDTSPEARKEITRICLMMRQADNPECDLDGYYDDEAQTVNITVYFR